MSPQQKRSSQYDWFKGSTGKNGKMEPKEIGKVIWKFVKIFFYFSLFVFSATGCIQTLILKSSNSVGRGVEFYSAEKEIAPHVTSYKVSSTTSKIDDKTKIYSLGTVDANYWLSDKTPESKADLENVHTTIGLQGNNLKLQDAFKGSVEAIRLLQEDDNDKVGLLSAGKDLPFVMSTKSTVNNYPAATTPTIKFLDKVDATDTEPVKYIIRDLKLDSSIANDESEKNKARAGYSQALLSTFYSTYYGDPSLTLFNQITGNVGDDVTSDKVKIEQGEAQNKAIISMLGYLGYSYDKTASDASSTNEIIYKYKTGFLPGLGTGGTNWRPLVTWGDAWKEGPFYGIFVYPVAFISATMIHAMPFMSGWETLFSIFIVVFVVRMLSFLLSFKATMQQTKMQELSSKKAIIDAKYAAYKGNKQMENRQRQEVSEMYKKEGVSMFGSISSMFLTMPFFLSIWRTIGALPHIKSAVWLGINFSATSWRELFSGSYQYLPLMLVAAIFAAFQQILPRLLTKRRDRNRINVHQQAAMKKNNKTQNIMMIVFVVMAVVFSAGLQVYWIAGGMWMIIQSFITHALFINQSKKKKRKKVQV